MEDTGISTRKAEHIKIVLDNDVSSSLSTGLDDYSFIHCALPDINLEEVDTSTTFLDKQLAVPLLISSMTGGTIEAQRINMNLARAADQMGIALGVGSQRAMIENPDLLSTFSVRKFAPKIPILANLGAIQLNYGVGLDDCKRAVEMIEADALILHLNPLQEALQPEGNVNWIGLRPRIEEIIQKLGYPVIIKEVGWGISADLVKIFSEMDVYAIDIAGAGGTSWSQVEMNRLSDPGLQRVAAAFRSWGIPTARAIEQACSLSPQSRIIASGGLKNGIDLAKCIGLGAILGGMAGCLLKAAAESDEAVYQKICEIQLEMKICLFSAGLHNISELSHTARMFKVDR